MCLGERKSPSSVSDLLESSTCVEPLRDARTMLVDFFSILLGFRLDTFNIEPDLDFVANDEPAAI